MKKAIFFVIILLMFFLILYYNTSKMGNNIIIKDENEIVDYVINNIQNYDADISVTVNSNKSQNTYNMKQKVEGDNSSLEITSSGKINGLKIELQDGILYVKNTELKLDKIYENYKEIMNNSMFLTTFINEFKNGKSTTYMEDDKIIFETEDKQKKLYVDMKTIKPVKLEIKDNTKRTSICIIYNNIEIK